MSKRRRRAADPYSVENTDNQSLLSPDGDKPEAESVPHAERAQTPTERRGVPLAQLDDTVFSDEADAAPQPPAEPAPSEGGLDELISHLIGEDSQTETTPATLKPSAAERQAEAQRVADEEGLWPQQPSAEAEDSVWPVSEPAASAAQAVGPQGPLNLAEDDLSEIHDISELEDLEDPVPPTSQTPVEEFELTEDEVGEESGDLDFAAEDSSAAAHTALGDDAELWATILEDDPAPETSVASAPVFEAEDEDVSDEPASRALPPAPEQADPGEPERAALSAEHSEELLAQSAATSWWGRVRARLQEAEQPDEADIPSEESLTSPPASPADEGAVAAEHAPALKEPAQSEEPSGPAPHCAAREALLGGANPLPVRLDFENGVDEINHALSAFTDLQYGQTGFIKFSVRSHPSFRAEAGSWLNARKHGQDLEADKDNKKKLSSWVSYLGAAAWWNVMGGPNSKTPPPTPPHKRGEGLKPLGSRATAEEKEAWKQTELKMKDSTHYETILRVGVVGPAEEAEESERIADEVSGGFNLFDTEHQEITWRPADPYDALLGLMPTKLPADVPMVLSARELAGMAHVPDDETNPHGLRVKRSRFKQLSLANPIIEKDPYNPKAGNIPIGRIFPDSDDERVICLNNAELDKHLLVVGKTGSGKSSWMIWNVFGVAKAGYPIVLLDPHGQLTDDVCKSLIVNCPERVDDLIYCDLSDSQWPVAFNPLDIQHRHQVEPTVASVSEMLSTQMNLGSNAPRAVIYAQAALTALCSANLVLEDPDTKCTLLDVVPFFTNEQFRRMIVEFCDNVAVQQNFDVDNGQFENQPDKTKVDISQPIVRAFSQLGSSDSFSAVFSAARNKLSLARLVSEKKIVLIKLSHFSHQAKLGEFVGSLVLPWLLSSMDDWGRHKDEITGEQTGSGCRVFVDEAPTLFGPDSSAPKVLAEARKYDLGMIMAAQFVDQFPQQIIEASLANTASKIALPIDPNVAASVAKAVAGGSKAVTPADLSQLPNFHYYGNVLLPAPGGLSPSGPFSAACLPPIKDKLDEEQRELRQRVIDQSREQLCNSMEDVRRSQKERLNNIMRALQTRLAERAENTYRPSDIETPGATFDIERGWS